MNILVCPDCRGSLTLDSTKKDGEETIEGKLTCTKCGTEFAVHESIPQLLPKE